MKIENNIPLEDAICGLSKAVLSPDELMNVSVFAPYLDKVLDAAERSIELDKKLKSFEDTTLDGTPFESEPYIRGRDAGVDGTCIALEKILDTGEHTGTFGSERLQKLAERLIVIIEKAVK